ncbi:hypothetical protein D3C75_1137310 [compost metagenome]
MRAAGKAGIRLIEANMAIAADSQNLQIHRTAFFQQLVVGKTFRFKISRVAIRNMCFGRVNINVIEQMLIHEAAVALRMINR